jgi:hypothetical protein
MISIERIIRKHEAFKSPPNATVHRSIKQFVISTKVDGASVPLMKRYAAQEFPATSQSTITARCRCIWPESAVCQISKAN